MIDDQNMNNLAESLSKSGLAASPTEAMRMARNIIGTEKKVAEDFDQKNEILDKQLSKRTYEEEVNHLIEKTSMENKDFHIPIKGYKRDDVVKEEEYQPKKEEVAEPKIEDNFDDLIGREPTKPVVEKQETVEEIEPEKTIIDESPSPSRAEFEEPKPVVTNVLDDERALNEIMQEDAENIYKNQGKSEEEPDFILPKAKELPANNSVDEPVAAMEEPAANQPEDSIAQPEAKEVDKEIKNPIDDVDLMDYFKFG